MSVTRRPLAPKGLARAFVPAAVALAALALAAGPGAEAAAAKPPALVWSTSRPAVHPPPLEYAAAAYDADTASVVLFGGRMADGTLSSTTWVWNGTVWHSYSYSGSGPSARELASMAFDPALHRLILFGGQDAERHLLDHTWAWNGRVWIQQQGGTAPPRREAAAFAYAGNGALLLFGGTGYASSPPAPSTTTTTLSPNQSDNAPQVALADTWTWNGSWQPAPGGPSARSGASLSWDQANGTAVLFGGESTPAAEAVPRLLDDTWTWNGSSWSHAKPAASPPARFGAVSDFLGPAGGPLLTGGSGPNGDLADAWAWTGTTWVQAAVAGSPPPRAGGAGAAFVPNGGMLVFGGTGGGGATLGDTGLLSAAPAVPSTPTSRAAPATTPARTTPTTVAKAVTRSTPPTSAARTHLVPARPPVSAVAGPATGALQVRSDGHALRRGHAFGVAGGGYAPGAVVTITFHSTPAVLGTAVTGRDGWFDRTVSVPEGAAPGVHHVLATGRGPSGGTVTLVATVFVVVPGRPGTALTTTLSLVSLAILIPVAAYLAMAGAGVWRRRRTTKT